MRILFVVDYYQPALGYGSYYVPKALVGLGHQVVILTSNYFYPFPHYAETAGKILGPREQKVSVKKEEGVLVVRKRLWFEVFTRAIFGGQLEYLKKKRPDIVIVDKTAGYNTIVFSILKPFFGYRLISVDAHLPSGFMAEGNIILKEFFYLCFRLFFAGLINKMVDKFIAVQEATKDIMIKYYGVKSEKIVHIPLGTDLSLFKYDNTSRKLIRKRYSIGMKDFVVIYTGKIIKEKGVHILFSAFNMLAKRYSDIKLLLVGSANKDYERECFGLLEKEYHSRVILAGFQEAKCLYKFYSAADVGVWPLQESMSMNDAAACSLPFIANSKIGALARLSNNNALLYRIGSHRDLAAKIEYLYRNKRMRKKMGMRGRELMEREFDWRVIASRYID